MPRIYTRIPVEERVLRKLNRSTCIGDACGCHQGLDHCWPWPGVKTKQGYGLVRIYVNKIRRYELTHRVAYRAAYGPIPDNLLVCHKCDYKPCGRDTHFFLGTNQDNAKDAYQKGRLNMQALWDRRLPANHPNRAIGSKNAGAKLTELQVIDIINLIAIFRIKGKVNYSAIGRRFNVSHTTIRAIDLCQRWKVLQSEILL